jgi:ribonuclease HI
MHFKMYTDGGSRGNSNTSPAAIGFVIYDQSNRVIIKGSKYIGKATNNVAEYMALYYGLIKIKELNCTKVDLFLDSELVVKQVQGKYKIKNDNLKKINDKIMVELKDIEWTITHVRREYNKEADALVNQELDKIH